MRTRALASALAAALAACALVGLPQPARAQAPTGRVSGSVVDTSGAALPGVTVTIVAAASADPITTVTDAAGRFRFDAVPAGQVTIGFELEGFQPGSLGLEIEAGRGTIVNGHLAVASLEEAVTVYGLAPLEPPPPPQRPRAPEPLPLDEHDVASVCGPGRLDLPHAPLARIVAHRHDRERSLYVTGDEFV
ncbi:MAG: carboxypeptidase-like regulatory domain-containing protein, partial [Vicinamibacterales bacterium]|nr:carboxypeptidase-like regulatory domain-containing protein [Vicinamibacterales bacterium]